MNHDTPPRPGLARVLYESVLGLAAGFSLGFFAWMVADRVTEAAMVFWPWAAGGMVFGVTVVRLISTRRPGRGWVHLMWIPVVLFVVLMTMLILALRAFE